MTPLFNRLLIEVNKEEIVSASGIIIPDTLEAKKLEQATVIAAGADCTVVKAGDTILFKEYSADTIEKGGKEYNFIEETDVLATV